ncbi:MAG: transcriptional regulator GutM, partial [Clostridioides difficile]|nr:transcriptional regulator GutM [Clostridioides difficile]
MKLLVILFVAYILNTIFIMKQNKLYFKTLNRAKKKGDIVSTGKKKSYFSRYMLSLIHI